MKQKKVPMRMCTGCGEMKPKKELVRIVRGPEKEDGGAPEIALGLQKARKSRRLERAFSCRIPEEVYGQMEKELGAYGG